jgi:hypothetical protein
MLRLRKIPLYPLIEILQDLYESGADFIDLSGEQSEEGETPKDTIQITIKPEYMLHDERDDDDDIEDVTQEIEIDYSDDDVPSTIRKSLSDDDINDLI